MDAPPPSKFSLKPFLNTSSLVLIVVLVKFAELQVSVTFQLFIFISVEFFSFIIYFIIIIFPLADLWGGQKGL